MRFISASFFAILILLFHTTAALPLSQGTPELGRGKEMLLKFKLWHHGRSVKSADRRISRYKRYIGTCKRKIDKHRYHESCRNDVQTNRFRVTEYIKKIGEAKDDKNHAMKRQKELLKELGKQ